jgi:hypothetical protein
MQANHLAEHMQSSLWKKSATVRGSTSSAPPSSFCRKVQVKRGKYCLLLVFETTSRWILQDEAIPMPPQSVYMFSKTKIS